MALTKRHRLGDRFSQDNVVRSIGLLASSADGRLVGLTTVVEPDPNHADERGLIAPARLVRAIPVEPSERWSTPSGLKIADLADPDRCLMESVHRFDPVFGRVQGVVTAIRGAVRVRGDGWVAAISDLLEVRFDEADLDDHPTPDLTASDSGLVVTTWDGSVLGLLIAGEGRTGFVCPVAQFLAERDLKLLRLPEPAAPTRQAGLASAIDDGEAVYRGDLRREPRLETAEWDLEPA